MKPRAARRPASTSTARLALLTGSLALSAACGQTSNVGAHRTPTPTPTLSCPSFEDVDRMSSEELNAIPKKCDENIPMPSDAPGVYVTHWTDPDGDSTLDAVKTFRTPPFSADGTLAAADDEDWIGLDWGGGGVSVEQTTTPSDTWFAVMTKDGKLAPGFPQAPPSNDVRLMLPQGRYFVVLVGKDGGRELAYRIRVTSV